MASPVTPPGLSTRHALTDTQHTHAAEAGQTSQAGAVHEHHAVVSNQQALEQQMGNWFGRHATGSNRDEMDALIKDRAQRLDRMGETPASVEAVLAKAGRLDRGSSMMSGVAKLIPFAASGNWLKNLPMPAELSSLLDKHGGLTDALEQHGGGAFASAMKNSHWLRAQPDELEPVMANAARDKQPSQAESALGKTASTLLGSPEIRSSLLNGAANLASVATGGKVSPRLMKGAVAVGGAGLAGVFNHGMAKRNQRSGPEYLLGKKNWESDFARLKNQSLSQTVVSGGGQRLANIPLDIAGKAMKAAGGENSLTAFVKDALDGNSQPRSLRKFASRALHSGVFNASARGLIDSALRSESAIKLFTRFPDTQSLGPAAMHMLMDHFLPVSEQTETAEASSAPPTATLGEKPSTTRQAAEPTSQADFLANQLQARLNQQAG